MKKLLIISILFVAVAALTGCGQQPASQPTVKADQWLTHQNEKYGIKFQYPQYVQFEVSAFGAEGYYSVQANYVSSSDNFFDFQITEKAKVPGELDSAKKLSEDGAKNLHAPSELNFKNGKFFVTDGIGTMDYYFVTAYYEGAGYLYHFEMSRPDYSPQLLELFEKILATAELTK
jgi:predicted small lipoprotein YifL